MKIIKTPQFWRHKSLISFLLYPFSILYLFLYKALNQFKNPYISDSCFIICVGNAIAGGAGKTPFVISLAEHFSQNQELKIAIFSKGYGGKLAGPMFVENNHDCFEVGEEAVLMQKHANVIMAKNRLAGIKFAEKHGIELLIMDDGMQNDTVKKDITILLTDSIVGFGNGFLLPAGPMRETFSDSFNRADYVALVNHCSKNAKEDLSVNLSEFRGEIFICKPNFPDAEAIQNAKFVAFAGIGYPEKFFNSVRKVIGDENLLQEISFPDHYYYDENDIEKIINLAQELNVQIITTEKDYFKIPKKFRNQIFTLKMSISINESFLSVLNEAVNERGKKS